MKNLKTLAYQVKPAIPESNSLTVVNDKLYYYDENNKEYSLKNEEIDTSNFATKEELENYALSTHTHTYASITGKPTTFAPIIGTTATTALAGNTALLTIGTTATTAKAGNYVPTWAEITSKPATFAPTVGTTATTAKAGNYTPSATEVVTALNAMTPEQIDEIKTLLGITTV